MARLSCNAFLKLALSTCDNHIGLVSLPPVTCPTATAPLSFGLTAAAVPGFTVIACEVAEVAQPPRCRRTASAPAADKSFRNFIASPSPGLLLQSWPQRWPTVV